MTIETQYACRSATQTAGMAIIADHVSLSSQGYTNHAHVVQAQFRTENRTALFLNMRMRA
ncbi:UNVERIFIED_ORG: hypothetical protein J2W19_005059 [Shinella zoogloeoides]|nr:hypothetical protein [Shinella zoogloeoides]